LEASNPIEEPVPGNPKSTKLLSRESLVGKEKGNFSLADT